MVLDSEISGDLRLYMVIKCCVRLMKCCMSIFRFCVLNKMWLKILLFEKVSKNLNINSFLPDPFDICRLKRCQKCIKSILGHLYYTIISLMR